MNQRTIEIKKRVPSEQEIYKWHWRIVTDSGSGRSYEPSGKCSTRIGAIYQARKVFNSPPPNSWERINS